MTPGFGVLGKGKHLPDTSHPIRPTCWFVVLDMGNYFTQSGHRPLNWKLRWLLGRNKVFSMFAAGVRLVFRDPPPPAPKKQKRQKGKNVVFCWFPKRGILKKGTRP